MNRFSINHSIYHPANFHPYEYAKDFRENYAKKMANPEMVRLSSVRAAIAARNGRKIPVTLAPVSILSGEKE